MGKLRFRVFKDRFIWDSFLYGNFSRSRRRYYVRFLGVRAVLVGWVLGFFSYVLGILRR